MISEVDLGGSIPVSLIEGVPLTSRDLAHTVDRHLAAVWRGEERQDDEFFRWLTSWWSASTTPEPATPPSAVSVLGAGGGGIRWYQIDAVFVGYVDGRAGCYRVPANASLPKAAQRTTSPVSAR